MPGSPVVPNENPNPSPAKSGDICLPSRVDGSRHVLVGVTGSVAAIKAGELLAKLRQCDDNPRFEVQVVATKCAEHFLSKSEIPIPSDVTVFGDEHEWSLWQKRGDPVLHIELRKWADAFLIAPLDANTMAKIASGICDNLLTCVARAWNTQKPLLFAPAMNTFMYEHPLTEAQISILTGFGYMLVPSVEKRLICGDKGMGAMASVDRIVNEVRNALL